MLRAGRYSLRLDTFHIICSHTSCQKGIFRKVFKISSAEWISLEIHSRSKDHIRSVKHHFLSHKLIEFFYKIIIPCTGQTGTDRNKRCRSRQADSRRSVCRSHRHNAFLTQALRYTSVNCGISRCSKRTSHCVISPGKCFQIIKIKLRYKLVQCICSVIYIIKSDRILHIALDRCWEFSFNPVMKINCGSRDRLIFEHTVIVHHTVKALLNCIRLCTLLCHSQFRLRVNSDFLRISH